jgi:hypothetical protein
VRLSDGFLGALEELDNALHHTDSLLKRAVVIVRRESVLLKEILTNNLGNFKNCLLILRKRIFTDELHDFSQIFFFL